jgi:hypothetical protein
VAARGDNHGFLPQQYDLGVYHSYQLRLGHDPRAQVSYVPSHHTPHSLGGVQGKASRLRSAPIGCRTQRYGPRVTNSWCLVITPKPCGTREPAVPDHQVGGLDTHVAYIAARHIPQPQNVTAG